MKFRGYKEFLKYVKSKVPAETYVELIQYPFYNRLPRLLIRYPADAPKNLSYWKEWVGIVIDDEDFEFDTDKLDDDFNSISEQIRVLRSLIE